MDNEPNFEGEKMKMPAQTNASSVGGGKRTESQGVMILALVVALIVILIGIVFWYRATNQVIIVDDSPSARPSVETNREPETTTATAQTDTLEVMSTSDEISAIEADLESTDLNNLEAELLQIEAELEAEIE